MFTKCELLSNRIANFMKVHLVRKETIEDYVTDNASGRVGFTLFLGLLKYAEWEAPEDILATFPTADLLGNGTNRVVFNIGSNKHRLICKYHFGEKQVHLYICWMGTHAAYNKLCEAKNPKKKWNQYDINLF